MTKNEPGASLMIGALPAEAVLARYDGEHSARPTHEPRGLIRWSLFCADEKLRGRPDADLIALATAVAERPHEGHGWVQAPGYSETLFLYDPLRGRLVDTAPPQTLSHHQLRAISRLVGAAIWAYDDAGDAGETHGPDGVEYDSMQELREAREAVQAALADIILPRDDTEPGKPAARSKSRAVKALWQIARHSYEMDNADDPQPPDGDAYNELLDIAEWALRQILGHKSRDALRDAIAAERPTDTTTQGDQQS